MPGRVAVTTPASVALQTSRVAPFRKPCWDSAAEARSSLMPDSAGSAEVEPGPPP